MAGLSHRQTEILNIARAFGRVMVEDLAKRFEVSAQTIRKDLNDLCDQRSLTRIHGGAIIASGVENLAYEARRFVAAEEKRAIGIAAASRIPNGCSLFINIGTTTEEVASALTSHEDLLVITNNLNVAMLLYRHPRIEVIVAGGAVRRADGAVIGSTAISLIGQFKVDYAIIGASAIDEEGALLDFDYREVQAAQAIIANARSVMLVADSTKLRRSAPVRIAHLSQIQTFVTDAPLPAGLASICHHRGIEVVEAMDKPAADIDEPGGEPASTVTRLPEPYILSPIFLRANHDRVGCRWTQRCGICPRRPLWPRGGQHLVRMDVVARLGLKTSLTPWDIAALRFGVAGLLLLPYVMSKGLALNRLGWIGLAAIVLGGGAPVLFANAGLMFAPAAHAGALFPGVMPLMVALLAAALLREPFTAAKKIGFVLILLGVFGIAWGTGGDAIESGQTIGHVLFLGSAVAWACYTVAMRRARLDGLHAAGIAAVGALVSLHAGLFVRWRVRVSQGSMERYGSASVRAGDSDGNRFTRLLRARSQHPRRLERCRIRRTVSGDDGCHGDSNSWRVADDDGLDCDRRDFRRRLRRERRSAATTADLTAVSTVDCQFFLFRLAFVFLCD